MFNKVLIIVILCMGGLIYSASSQEVWPIKEWPRSNPSEQKLNKKILDQLVNQIREGREFPNQDSLLIVKNGYLVVEEYFNGYNAERIHTLQSVSKSITSAVMGIAIAKGFIKGVNEKVLDFFKNIPDIKNMDDKKASMKFQDLLTMRSGTDYHEGYSTSPHSQLNRLESGWDLFYLNRPMEWFSKSH